MIQLVVDAASKVPDYAPDAEKDLSESVSKSLVVRGLFVVVG